MMCVLFCLASCAVLPGREGRIPSVRELPGSYDYGHAGFSETVELLEDGTFTQVLHPHLDDQAASFEGVWRLEGKRLIFGYRVDPAPSQALLSEAEVFHYKGKPAFVRLQDLKAGKVHEWWVYAKRG